MEMAGDDGFIDFHHIELTYPIRSNMGAEDIIGPAARIPADQADTVLQSVPTW